MSMSTSKDFTEALFVISPVTFSLIGKLATPSRRTAFKYLSQHETTSPEHCFRRNFSVRLRNFSLPVCDCCSSRTTSVRTADCSVSALACLSVQHEMTIQLSVQVTNRGHCTQKESKSSVIVDHFLRCRLDFRICDSGWPMPFHVASRGKNMILRMTCCSTIFDWGSNSVTNNRHNRLALTVLNCLHGTEQVLCEQHGQDAVELRGKHSKETGPSNRLESDSRVVFVGNP